MAYKEHMLYEIHIVRNHLFYVYFRKDFEKGLGEYQRIKY